MTIGRSMAGIVLLLLGLGLLGSLWQQRRLARALADREWDIHQLIMDPLGLAKSWPSVSPKDPARCRLVLLGDSRAREWSPPLRSDLDWINRGMDGQSTAQVLGRWRSLLALAPDVVVIQVGVNDLWRQQALLERGEERFREQLRLRLGGLAMPPEETWAKLRQLLDEMGRAKLRVVVVTIFPMGPSSSESPWLDLSERSANPDEADPVSQQIAMLNQRLLALREPGVTVFDAGAILGDDRGDRNPSYWRDRLHLSEQGYRALDRGLLAAIDRACLGHNRR